jgi:hypothetical protein
LVKSLSCSDGHGCYVRLFNGSTVVGGPAAPLARIQRMAGDGVFTEGATANAQSNGWDIWPCFKW